MKFIKLTQSVSYDTSKRDIYVNMREIKYFRRESNGAGSYLHMNSEEYLIVDESPSEIIELLKGE